MWQMFEWIWSLASEAMSMADAATGWEQVGMRFLGLFSAVLYLVGIYGWATAPWIIARAIRSAKMDATRAAATATGGGGN